MANGRHIMHFEELNGVRPNETADILIGVVLILVVITGIGGNIPAVIYFWKKRKKNIPKLLYTIISLTDVCLSAVIGGPLYSRPMESVLSLLYISTTCNSFPCSWS